MRALIAALLIASCVPAPAAEVDEEGRIVLTAAEMRHCNDNGGCALITLKELAALILLARGQCDKNTIL